ncbi:class I adenylate-forming enzyme family protein [Cryptosporangium aurantiacum]|uniref:Long-chain acyl-CoA synthetase n=1 Tax=Cryptosporangium aurantiacum TaxID=134849 RepID=A0A1M7QXX4_9ACTN|nr:AMP-binding protein [Cryptosporangium aurantiacum]SHN36785.1 long-chain acyl-CoA synthetase [Cryptosporangium aurantiacum]
MEVVTAVEHEALQRAAAGGLSKAGVVAGDRIAVFAQPTAGVLAVALGALRSGIIPVMLDPALPQAERADLLADCRPALTVDGSDAVDALLSGAPLTLGPAPLGRPMHYTSGTSGRRKGVWSGVLDPGDAAALLAEEVELWKFDAADRHLVLSPLYHSAPLRFAAGTLLSGGTVVLPGKFDPAVAIAAIAEHHPTTTFCVPTQLRRLLGAGPLPSLDSFRLLAHAGEPCPAPLKERVVEAFGEDVVAEFYGSTEGQFTVCPATEWRSRPGTVGRARPHRRLSVDADGAVWCAVPRYARFAYWDAPEKTADAWRGDAFSVGDVGRLDADGYLYLEGRRDDLVITGGVNVYPREVERVLDRCPGVEEVAVFGVADDHWGQRLCAAVVGTASTAALQEFAAAELPPARRPKEYHVVPEMPRTTTGKIRRLDLAAHLALGDAPQARQS